METKGKALIDHWSWAAEKGVMNRNTAAGLRAACVQVLGVLDDPDEVDIESLNIDELLTRFQNLRKQRFKPQVLEAYKRRFRSAVKSYKDYLENPGAWKPATQDRSSGVVRRPRSSDASLASEGMTSGVGRPYAAVAPVGSEEYRFPLRPGVMARLTLPVDLTRDEVRRLKAFVDMLVVGNSDQEELGRRSE
jgi:hypothetical protein